jgi:ATP-dependent RNA helicase DeaD
VHRIGRTGRAGRKGRAILLVEPRERGLLRAIERTFRCPVPQMEPPSAEQLTNSRIERFTGELRKTLTDKDLDFFYRLVTNIARDQELEPMDIAAALAFQLQRERPLEVEELPRPPQRRDGPDQRGRPRGDDRGRPQGNWRDRGDRPDRRPPAGDDRRGPPREQRRGRDDSDLVGYRIEVGHDHGVTPREIVGAIANEAGIEGRYIGRIDIRGDHSTVDLPSGMPKEMLHHLKRVYVRGQALRITELGKGGDDERPPRHFKARDNGPGEQRPRGHSGGGYSDRGPGQGRGGYPKDRGPRDR